MAYKILIADDHTVVRHGTRLIIEDTFTEVEVFEASSVKQMSQILKDGIFDLLILDINMPGGNSIHMLDLAKQKQTDLKILVFSAYDEKLYASRYLQAGANGYLHKHSSENLLKEAIVAVLERGSYVTQSLKEHIYNSLSGKEDKDKNPISLLSNREIEVAELLVQGLGGIEISDKLNIQTTTVSSHKKKIFEKLQVANLPELIEKFRQYNLS